MPQDGFALFSRCHEPISQVFWKAFHVFSTQGAAPLHKCIKLSYDTNLDAYFPTPGRFEYDDVNTMLQEAATWQGVGFPFVYHIDDIEAHITLLIWTDNQPKGSTVALREDAILFSHQRENAGAWRSFMDLLITLTEELDSTFCFVDRDVPLHTMNDREILNFAEQVRSGRRIPIYLAIHERLLSSTEALKVNPEFCQVTKRFGYTIVSDKEMGTPVEA